MARTAAARLFQRLSPSTERTLVDMLRGERVGGALMLLGTAVALVWANSRWGHSYESLREFVPIGAEPSVGGATLHLDLTLGEWATDGILSIFFFVVGLELKRELVVGELRRPGTALVPIVAAIGGMVVPAAMYLAINAASDSGTSAGWAVPTATDIAFALAVLTVVGRRLPSALRAFLLTLAVVDDLIAIVIIAVAFSHGINVWWLAAALLPLGAVRYLTTRRVNATWILLPVAALAWLFVHESGIHATVAGVALGMVVPAHRRGSERRSPVELWEHRWGPASAGFAVPVFAFFAAGVALDGDALAAAAKDPAAVGVAAGLILGKPIGILLATFIASRFVHASLNRGLSWWDVSAVAIVGGIGFTVSLLIGDLAFGEASAHADHVKAAVLIGSIVAAVAGGSMLAWRDRHYGALAAKAEVARNAG